MRRTRASSSELDGVIVSGQTALTSGIAVDLDDGSGPIRVMVGAATGIDVTGWTRDARLHLRGVVGQRDSSGSGTAGYRVQPRDAADILAVAPPATPSPSPSPNPSATPVPSANPAVLSIAAARAMGVNTRVTVRGVVTLPAGSGGARGSRHPGLVGRHPAAAGRRCGQPQARRAGRGGRYPLDAVGHGDHPRRRCRLASWAARHNPTAMRRATGALGEAQEAMLVVVRGAVTLTPRRTSAQNVYFDIDDGSGPIRDLRQPRRPASRPTRSCLDRSSRGGWRARPGDDRQAAGPRISALAARIARTCGSWRRPPGARRAAVAPPAVAARSRTGPSAGSGGGAGIGQPGTAASSAKPAKQQGVPRLEAPAPTAAIPSAIPQASEPAQIQREGAGNDASPAPASAALLVLAAACCSAGAAWRSDRPAWRDAWWPTSASASDGAAIVKGASCQGPPAAIGASPRLVPLTVVEDARTSVPGVYSRRPER